MFRKGFCILVAALFLLGAAFGCGKEEDSRPKSVGLAIIHDDVAESADWQRYNAEIVSCEIIKRQTNPEDKTDYVWLQVVGENSQYRIEAHYKLTYVLYNEGWLLEELIPDPKADPVLTALAVACVRLEPEQDVFAIIGETGIVTVERTTDPQGLPIVEGMNISGAVKGSLLGDSSDIRVEALIRLLQKLNDRDLLNRTPRIERIDMAELMQVRLYSEGMPNCTLEIGDASQFDESLDRLQQNRSEILQSAAEQFQNGAESVTIYLYAKDGVVIAPNNSAAPQPTAAPVVDAKSAQIQQCVDNGVNYIAVSALVPAHATLTITLPHQDDYFYTNTGDEDMTRRVKIPVGVFNPNEPLTEATREITPEIYVTMADGSTYTVNCPSFTVEYPKLNISIGSPVANEKGIIMAPESNEIKISGTIDEPTADVTINGNPVQVYEGGMFVYDFTFPAGTSEDAVETLKIVAMKDNYVTAEKEISIHAYKFVPEPVVLEVRSEGSALRADAIGKLTVTGKTTPGAALTADSDNRTNVLCGSVTVDGEGNFSFQITMGAEYYGASMITLRAEKENTEPAQRSFRVIKGFKDKDAFLKYYNAKKTFVEIGPKKTSIAELLANQTTYATNAYGYRITVAVAEVINKDGDIIVKATVNKTGETVYIHNLSEKWTPADNIGSKYNIYCNFLGTYKNTGCCEFLCWFAKKP